MAQRPLCRQTPKVGAECPNWARSDLSGGRSEMSVPTGNVKTLFYSGDWRRVTRGGAFCAFWPGKPPAVTQAASMSAVPARFGPHMAARSRPDSRHQGLDAEDVERSPQIVDERRQAELGPDVVESLHQ